jgi:hypothetical protein
MLSVEMEIFNYLSGEKCLSVHRLQTMHNVKYYKNKLRGTGELCAPINSDPNCEPQFACPDATFTEPPEKPIVKMN